MLCQREEGARREHTACFTKKVGTIRNIHRYELRVSAIKIAVGLRHFLSVAVLNPYFVLKTDHVAKSESCLDEWCRDIKPSIGRIANKVNWAVEAPDFMRSDRTAGIAAQCRKLRRCNDIYIQFARKLLAAGSQSHCGTCRGVV